MADTDPIQALIQLLRKLDSDCRHHPGGYMTNAAGNEIADVAKAAADTLAALTAQLHENPPHKITGLKDGKAIHASDCYACERNGLQERIRFTADYETLRTQLHEVTTFPPETRPAPGPPDAPATRARTEFQRHEAASATLPDVSRSTVDACLQCGGPHPFDTSIPSVLWNQVIRAQGLPEYLCTTCIVAAFVNAGVSFTAELWGAPFVGVPVEVRINSVEAVASQRIQDENNRLRWQLREVTEKAEKTNHWHRRAQKAAAALCVTAEDRARQGMSIGRRLAGATWQHYKDRAEAAEAALLAATKTEDETNNEKGDDLCHATR